MNCPTCKKHDEFVFEENIKVWRCDRCHERFIIKPRRTNCDASEEFIRAATTNADRIRAMSDEELATEITKNPSIPCRMCEYYNHKLGHCDARRDFACVTAYAEALALDWLKQPLKEE